MDEEPIIYGCKAVHIPQRLEIIVGTIIAQKIILNSIPLELKMWSQELIQSNLISYSRLDEALLCLSGYNELHLQLRESIKKMKVWWDEQNWFGGFGAPLRNLVQERISCLLNNLDSHSHCPLFRFTCQLCFTKEAGIFPNDKQIVVQVPKQYCSHYVSFLNYIKPFQVELLINTCMIFGNSVPLITIFENSPNLRSIHMHYNSDDYTMRHLGLHCHNLESLVVEGFIGKLCISEPFLYRTFFCDLSKEDVVGAETLNSVNISFPKLTHLDLGKSRMVQEFLCVISFYYPHLKSVSCNSSNFVALYLLKACPLPLIHTVRFNIQDLCLTCDCLVQLEERTLPRHFPKVKHITLSFDAFSEDKLDVIKEKAIIFIASSSATSLTVHVPFEGVKDYYLMNILPPLFNAIGPTLRSLQFLLMQSIDFSLLASLINACPCLELLGLRLLPEANLHCDNSKVNISPLNHLKSLSVSSEQQEDPMTFYDQLKPILSKAPHIANLELLCPISSVILVLQISHNKQLKELSNMVLKLNPEIYLTSDRDTILDWHLFSQIVERFPQLHTLVLIGVPSGAMARLKKVVVKTAFRIASGRKRSYVAYQGYHAKYVL